MLLERKDGRIYFWDGKVGTKTRYGLIVGSQGHARLALPRLRRRGRVRQDQGLVGGRLPAQPLPDRLSLRRGRLRLVRPAADAARVPAADARRRAADVHAAPGGHGGRRPDVPLPDIRCRNGHGQDPGRPDGDREVGRRSGVVGRPEDQHPEHQARVQAVGLPLRPHPGGVLHLRRAGPRDGRVGRLADLAPVLRGR